MQDDKKDFVQNLLVAVQHNLRALDQSLDVLRRSLETPPEQDPRNPVCPICGGDVSDITTMGARRKAYQCTARGCEFRGEL